MCCEGNLATVGAVNPCHACLLGICRVRIIVKVVFVTANPSQIGDADCLGYIRKPFNDAAILAAAELATTGQALRGGSELIQIRQRER